MATKRGKNKKLPQRRKRFSAPAAPQVSVRRAYECAIEAYEEQDPEETISYLELIEAQGFLPIEALQLYVNALLQLDDHDNLVRIAGTLADRCPNDSRAHFLAGMASISSTLPISALLHLERFLELDPDHPEAPEVEVRTAKIREQLPNILDAFKCDLPKELPRISSVEKIQHLFKLGRFNDVYKRAEEHLKSYPNDLRVRNNLAEALALQGNGKKAFEIVSETLKMDPRNFFARAARCRLAYFHGQIELSTSDAETILTLEPRIISDLTKAAQSFAFIGHEAGVRWAYQEAVKRNWMDANKIDAGLLECYYGTCLAFAGDTNSAKLHWKKSVSLVGDTTTAKHNLEDVELPVDTRCGPGYLSLPEWLPKIQMEEILTVGARAIEDKDDDDEEENESITDSLAHLTSKFMAKYPEIERLILPMLQRGDSTSQEMALMLSSGCRTQKLNGPIFDYACGKRGSDKLRYQALTMLKERKYKFETPVTMFVKGEAHQIEMIGFEITNQPTIPPGRTRRTIILLEQAANALSEEDGIKAERLLRQVRTVEPYQPDVLHNLAMALYLQDRFQEAEALIAENEIRNPDYFFGKIIASQKKLEENQYDEALEILLQLQRRDKLHGDEFTTLAKAMIHVFSGKREFASAQHWLEMLKNYDPYSLDLPYFEQLAKGTSRWSSIWKRMFGMND